MDLEPKIHKRALPHPVLRASPETAIKRLAGPVVPSEAQPGEKSTPVAGEGPRYPLGSGLGGKSSKIHFC